MIINDAITNVYIVIAVWIPVTVVPRSFATVAIDTFITDASRIITNCAAANVTSTALAAPLTACSVFAVVSVIVACGSLSARDAQLGRGGVRGARGATDARARPRTWTSTVPTPHQCKSSPRSDEPVAKKPPVAARGASETLRNPLHAHRTTAAAPQSRHPNMQLRPSACSLSL